MPRSRRRRAKSKSTRAPRSSPPDSPGRILGYDVLFSSRRGRRPRKSYEDPEGTLRSYLRKFAFKAVCARAAHVMARRGQSRARFASDLAEGGFDHRVEFVPYLVRRVIIAAAKACESDLEGRDMSAEELRHALIIAEDIIAPADRETRTRDEKIAVFLRLQQLALHDIVDMSYVFREMMTSLDVLALCERDGLLLDDRFAEAYGVTYRRFLLACLAFFGKVTTEGQEGWILRPGPVGDLGFGVDPEAVLRLVEADRAGQVAEWERNLTPGFEAYSLSPLKRFPVVKHADGDRTVPVANDLLDRPLRLFFYDLIEVLTGTDNGTFRSALGEAQETLVQRSLQTALAGRGQVHRAAEVLQPHSGERLCDFVCIERSSVTFIEVKSARFPLKVDVTKTQETLREAITRNGGFADAVAQLADSIHAYREGRTSLPRRGRVFGLVVTPGERVGLNTNEVRRIIAESGVRQAAPEKLKDYLIADDLGFEALVRHVSTRKPLGGTIRELLRGRDIEADVHTRLPRGLPIHPLRGEFDLVPDRLEEEIRARAAE